MNPRESRTSAPLWLEYSGLPKFLSQKIKGNVGWVLFKKICELDCERNSAPGTVEISLEELEARTGLTPDVVRKAASAMRKLKLLASFIPDNDEEAALFRIVTPLSTPVSVQEIRELDTKIFQSAAYFRYADNPSEESENTLPVDDKDLKEIVDLYFDVVGVKMNAFILDDLRMLPQRFAMQEVRNVFRRARKNEIRSLNWIMQELVRLRVKRGTPVPQAETPLFAGNEDDKSFNF